MKELTRTKRLIVAMTIFVFIILIGLLTLNRPDYEYRVSTAEMVSELTDPSHYFSLDDAMDLTTQVLIDLRNPYDFNRGTLENAINIPVSDILDGEYMDLFRQLEEDSAVVVLFSNEEREANGAWMFLRQLGFNSFKVLEGGYQCLVNKGIQEEGKKSGPACSGEEPILDYAAFMAEAGGSPADPVDREPVTIQPVKRTKKTSTEGGC
jgi:rhodanese-related sulfurtransferase